MSLPVYPAISPPLSREGSLNMLISSIAMEELALSHIINAEGEKLQYILGTIPGLSGPLPTVDQVLQINKSIRMLLDSVYENQSILRSKLSQTLAAPSIRGIPGITGGIGPLGATGPDGLMGAEGPAGPGGISGPRGADGVSVTILGVYDNLAELEAEHPSGFNGNGYMVAGTTLYIWSATAQQWISAGEIEGETGPLGPTGVFGEGEALFRIAAAGETATVDYGGELAFSSPSQDITVNNQPQVIIEAGPLQRWQVYRGNLSSSARDLSIRLENITYQVVGGNDLSIYISSDQPIEVDVRRLSQYNVLGIGYIAAQEWDSYLLDGSLRLQNAVYNSSDEKNTIWLRQRNPVTQAWSLYELNLFSSNNGARTTLWLRQIEAEATYDIP